jgi:hypothetical protein
MRQIEPDPTAHNRLMMGPDGAVHVVPAGTRAVPPPEAVAEHDTGLPGVRRAPAVGVCFSYSVGTPIDDSDTESGLRDIRRVPQGGVCFAYRAEVPRLDGGQGGGCFRFLAETQRRDGGTGSGCFAY